LVNTLELQSVPMKKCANVLMDFAHFFGLEFANFISFPIFLGFRLNKKGFSFHLSFVLVAPDGTIFEPLSE